MLMVLMTYRHSVFSRGAHAELALRRYRALVHVVGGGVLAEEHLEFDHHRLGFGCVDVQAQPAGVVQLLERKRNRKGQNNNGATNRTGEAVRV